LPGLHDFTAQRNDGDLQSLGGCAGKVCPMGKVASTFPLDGPAAAVTRFEPPAEPGASELLAAIESALG